MPWSDMPYADVSMCKATVTKCVINRKSEKERGRGRRSFSTASDISGHFKIRCDIIVTSNAHDM